MKTSQTNTFKKYRFFGLEGGYWEATFASKDGINWKLISEASARSIYANIGTSWWAFVEDEDREEDWDGNAQVFKTWEHLLPMEEYDSFTQSAFWHEEGTPLPQGCKSLKDKWEEMYFLLCPDLGAPYNGGRYRLATCVAA